MKFQLKWERLKAEKPHPQFAAILGGVGTAIAGGVASAAVGSLLGGGGGGGGGSSGPSPTASAASTGASLAQLLGGGNNSLTGLTQAAANAASPFGGHYSDYQQMLAQQVLGQQSSITNGQKDIQAQLNQTLNYGNGTDALSMQMRGMAGTQKMDPALAALSNPTNAQQFEYQTGLNAMSRNQAATGSVGSGAALLEAQQYGQKSASQFLQQDFNNVATTQQLSNATQQQNFNQLSGLQGQIYNESSNASSLLQNMQNSTVANEGSFNTLLAALSGATTGSPGTAGNILSGQFAQQQSLVGGALQGANGLMGSLGNALGSATGSMLNNMGYNNQVAAFNGSSGYSFDGGGASAGTQVSGQTGSDLLAQGNNYSDANYGGY